MTPIWPPTGIAIASLLLFGYRYSAAIFIGALLVNSTTAVPLLTTLGISIGNMLEAVTAAVLLNRSAFRKDLADVQDVWKLLIYGALLSTLVSAFIGCFSLWIGNVITTQEIVGAFQVWWMGDMTGAIWITPILLVLGSHTSLERSRTLEFFSLNALLLIGCYSAFLHRFNYTYALFPLLLWSSMRYLTLGAAISTLIVSTVSILMTINGYGPFVSESHGETLWLLNLFIGCTSLTTFIVAAVIHDRRIAQVSLEEANKDLEQRVVERTKVLELAKAEAVASGKRASFMAETSAVLSSTLDLETTLRAMAKATVPYLADCCVIDLMDDTGKLKRVEVVHKDPTQEQYFLQLKEYSPEDRRQHTSVRVVQSGRPELLREITDELLAERVHDNSHFQLVRKLGIRSAIAVPMLSGTKVIGVIGLSLVAAGRLYEENDVLLAQEFAKHATLAVHNSQLFKELQEANRFKDEFLATISHELRTPLTVILGWSKTLEQAGDHLTADMKRKALKTIARSAEVQAQIVEDLLDISRIRTGKFRLQLSSFSLAQTLNNAIDAIRPAASAKQIEIEVNLDPATETFFGDSDRFQQIFWNLLSNAVKFTPEGGTIQVASILTADWLELIFKDSGKGISNDFLPFVFQRFRQEDGSFSRKHTGLGLGLSLVKHFTELHGGSVSVETAGEGKGTTFVLRFPQRKITEDQPSAGPGSPAPLSLQNAKVLIVDDDPDTIEMLKHLIEQAGNQVFTAPNVSMAIKLLQEMRPDLLISDIAMPGEDGYALIQQVRALDDPQLNKIPAIALSAHASMEDQSKAAGYHLYLKKPIQPHELTNMIYSLTLPSKLEK